MEAIQHKNVVISGLIGVGKTTLTNKLVERLNWSIIEESVDNNPYLDLFYDDMHKYAFSMQIYFLNHRFEQEQKNVWNKKNTLQDRSMWEDIIFANMLHKSGHISDIDYSTYKQVYSNMINYVKKPSLILYLDVDPEIALERIKNRNRECEKNIDIKYLKSLKDNYDEWLCMISKTTRVIKLNWNQFQNINNVIDLIA